MTELERNNQIKQEYDRISVYFQDLQENEISVISPLIQNAAFMRVTLDDLQEIVAEQGPVEQYQNGANQYGLKQSAALQSYNSLIKNYAAVTKTLFGLLPPGKRPVEVSVMKNPEPKSQKQIDAEWNAALKFQARQRELDEMIKDAATLDERNRLTAERNSLKWQDFIEE